MSNQFNIDDLFSKAASQPVVASFGETKELFLTSAAVGATSALSKSTRVSTLKKGLIMLAIVSTIITAILWSGTASKQEPKTNDEAPIENPIETVTTTQDSIPDAKKEKKIKVKVPKMHSTRLMTSVNDFVEETDSLVTNQVFFADNTPKEKPPTSSEYKGEAPELKRPYQFPELTKDEIEANHKRKKKMVKALSKMDKKEYAYVPSGSFDYHGKPVSVQAFHMQTSEVSNIQYKTFLFDLLIQGRKDDFLKAKPDQAKWVETVSDSATSNMMQNMYFSHPAYDDYPVVNVSREGAELYCVWLTEEANKYNKQKGDPLMNNVRIPVRTEWEMAASGSGKMKPFPWGGPLAQNAKGCFLANYDPSQEGLLRDSSECEGCDTINLMQSDGAMFTAKTKTYNPNTYGLYNMSGNVAEMVYGKAMRKDPGSAGGSWMSDFESIKISGKDEYSGVTTANPSIGFRVVITNLGR
jgi:formylglycine-generating enzyme required for sulfatase activity